MEINKWECPYCSKNINLENKEFCEEVECPHCGGVIIFYVDCEEIREMVV